MAGKPNIPTMPRSGPGVSFLQSYTTLFLLAGIVLLVAGLLAWSSGIHLWPFDGLAPSAPEPGGFLQVNESELYRTTYDLQSFPSREYGTEGNPAAADYLYQRLSSIEGMEVSYQGGDLRNVIGTLPGQNRSSDAIVLVGAHYDSIAKNSSRSPGVTDNGCGVAIVLELARTLSRYSFNHTLQFAFWNAEEKGLLGSTAYAEDAQKKNRTILLYFNFDSSCCDPQNRNILDVMYDPKDEKASEYAALLTRRNAILETPFMLTYNRHDCASDYVPFQDRGYTTLTTHSEHCSQHTPYDTLDKASFPYARRNAQLGGELLAYAGEMSNTSA